MSEFKSVDRIRLQKAFAIAHKSAVDPYCDQEARRRFLAIAREIWLSCGEDGPYPERFGPDIETALSLAAAPEATS